MLTKRQKADALERQDARLEAAERPAHHQQRREDSAGGARAERQRPDVDFTSSTRRSRGASPLPGSTRRRLVADTKRLRKEYPRCR